MNVNYTPLFGTLNISGPTFHGLISYAKFQVTLKTDILLWLNFTTIWALKSNRLSSSNLFFLRLNMLVCFWIKSILNVLYSTISWYQLINKTEFEKSSDLTFSELVDLANTGSLLRKFIPKFIYSHYFHQNYITETIKTSHMHKLT